jgi:hypothetical protein
LRSLCTFDGEEHAKNLNVFTAGESIYAIHHDQLLASHQNIEVGLV